MSRKNAITLGEPRIEVRAVITGVDGQPVPQGEWGGLSEIVATYTYPVLIDSSRLPRPRLNGKGGVKLDKKRNTGHTHTNASGKANAGTGQAGFGKQSFNDWWHEQGKTLEDVQLALGMLPKDWVEAGKFLTDAKKRCAEAWGVKL